MSENSNLTGPTGGDSMTQGAEMNAQYLQGDMAWVLVATVLVFIMIPGIGLFYSGLARRNVGSSGLIWQSFMALGVVTFQWFFWGYSLTFSKTAGPFIGDLANFGTKDVLAAPSVGSTTVPDILFYVFQLMFACVTGILMIGGGLERGRLLPSAILLFCWTTIVYDPIACWTWNPEGWLLKLGSLDFAGGGPVHLNSGCASLAYALVLGKRSGDFGKKMPEHKPGNVLSVFLGTVFLWFGWFGFNGGSTLNMTLRSVYAFVNTNLAAAVGALTWALIDRYMRKGKLWSVVGICSGAIAGLVGITPAAGYVPIYFAVPIGVICAALANFAVDLKHLIRIDDGLDVFALHGVAGFAGNLLTGLFAANYIVMLDGSTEIDGGWLNGNYIQLAYQLAGSVTIAAYSFIVTLILCYALYYLGTVVPALQLRLSPEEEHKGLDEIDIGEMLLEFGVLEAIEEKMNHHRHSKMSEPPASSTDGDGAVLEPPAHRGEKAV